MTAQHRPSSFFSSVCVRLLFLLFFFFNDTATTEIYTLSLHDALPISKPISRPRIATAPPRCSNAPGNWAWRSEEHTSELQSHSDLVCRLLLEKKKQNRKERRNTRKHSNKHKQNQTKITQCTEYESSTS